LPPKKNNAGAKRRQDRGESFSGFDSLSARRLTTACAKSLYRRVSETPEGA